MSANSIDAFETELVHSTASAVSAVYHPRAFAGRTALVTGGAGGIGLSIATGFAVLGAEVTIIDVDEARTSAAVGVLSELGGAVTGRVADVTDHDTITAAVVEQRAASPTLDVLVNNVGGTFGLVRPFAEVGPEYWQPLYKLNFQHVLSATHAALPMLRRGSSVINITTVEAHRGYPFGAVYSAFKAAVRGFTRSLAVELAPHGVRVNCVAPETTDTALHDSSRWLPADEVDHIRRWIPLGRFGRPEDLTGAALFLASPLSSWTTGITVPVDGGVLASAGWLQMDNGRWSHRPIVTGTRWPPAAPSSDVE